MSVTKLERRKKIHSRIRSNLMGTGYVPRLNVFRSNRAIYAQVIDDLRGHTLVAASSLESSVSKDKTKTEQANEVGKILAERAKDANIEVVKFDRGGYLYHGRVKALADGAREGGMKF